MSIRKGLLWLMICCVLLTPCVPAQAVSYYTRAPWVLDSWGETYPVDAWDENSIVEQLAGKEQLPSAQERTIWVSGWIELSTGAYGDVCQLVWEGQVPGLTVSDEVGRDPGGNTRYPEEWYLYPVDVENKEGQLFSGSHWFIAAPGISLPA